MPAELPGFQGAQASRARARGQQQAARLGQVGCCAGCAELQMLAFGAVVQGMLVGVCARVGGGVRVARVEACRARCTRALWWECACVLRNLLRRKPHISSNAQPLFWTGGASAELVRAGCCVPGGCWGGLAMRAVLRDAVYRARSGWGREGGGCGHHFLLFIAIHTQGGNCKRGL